MVLAKNMMRGRKNLVPLIIMIIIIGPFDVAQSLS